MLLLSRRWLVSGSLGLLLGCRDDEDPPVESECDATGQASGDIALLPPPDKPLNQKTGVGWDARLYYDLSELTPDALVTDNAHFYIRTAYPDLLDDTAPWSIALDGLVEAPRTLSLDDLAALSKPQGVHLLECSGNAAGGAFGLMSAAEWSGAPMSEVLVNVTALPSATRILVSGFDEHSVPSEGGHSTPGASWIFTWDDLKDAFLATHMNGEVLPKDHGFPVRLLVPGWYGCCCIKWVNAIALVDDTALATEQMKEFAARTHQDGTPELARDYLPATLDQSAMPVRVEKWLHDGAIVYRLVGIMWGGYQSTDALTISFDGGASYEPVRCASPSNPRTWTLWSFEWRPPSTGRYLVRMGIDDPTIVTRRLDLGWYDREIAIDEI